MLAIIEASGKQYQVEEGKFIDLDLLAVEENTEFKIDKVLAVVAGEKSLIGKPYVEGAVVNGKILKHFKGEKLIVYKMKNKTGYRKKNGHRQQYSRVLIENIAFAGKEEVVDYSNTLKQDKEKQLEENQKALTARYEKIKARKSTPKQTAEKQK